MDRQGFIIDLDGTLFRGDTRLPGAVELVEAIRRAECPFLLMTNNSTRTPEEVAGQLQRLGIAARADEVFTSSQAASRYMREDGKGSVVYCIGEHGLKKEIAESGFELVTAEDDPDSDGRGGKSGREESSDGRRDRPVRKVDYVVQGLDRQFHYGMLQQALRWIGEGARFVQTNPDLRLPMDDGFIPGSGSIGAAIAAATGVEPVVIGKPSTIMMKYALERLGLPAGSVWMVGDNMRTDMAAGYAAGCRTALLLTGVTRREEIAPLEAETGVRVDLVAEHLPQLMERLNLQKLLL